MLKLIFSGPSLNIECSGVAPTHDHTSVGYSMQDEGINGMNKVQIIRWSAHPLYIIRLYYDNIQNSAN